MALRLDRSLEREVGSPGVTSWGGWIETWEETPELRWPNSVVVYDRMRRADAQVAGVFRYLTLPIRRARWRLEGGDPRIVQALELELGLTPEDEAKRRRRRNGISWDPFLFHVQLHLAYGHMLFEQVYEIGPPHPEAADGMPGRMAHLRKLAPRMPRTISRWDIAADGGLDGVAQLVNRKAPPLTEQVQLPIDRLVVFVNEQEGGDWTGTSILRASYKHWLIKDQLLRLDAMAGERNSMGIPDVTYGGNGTEAKALDIAKRFRAGEEAGIAHTEDYQVELLGIKGTVRDLLPSIQYHDRQVGKNMLAMLLDMGHDKGAYNLGETFAEVFALSLNAITAYEEEILTEHVVRDWVEINFGPDEEYPSVVCEEITPESLPTAEALKALADAGLLLPDDDTEAFLRRRFGLPEGASRPDGAPRQPAVPAPVVQPPGPGSVTVLPVTDPAKPQPVAASATLADARARLAAAQARLDARG